MKAELLKGALKRFMKRNSIRKSMRSTCLALAFAPWLLFACLSRTQTEVVACEQVRAALDIGSGTTKMMVARVDFCQDRVLEVLAPTPGAKLERQVDYLRNTAEGRFTEEIIAEGRYWRQL